MKINSLIFARGGSKALKDKNLKKFHGKPLIYYSIMMAKEIMESQTINISSDSIKILEEGDKLGADPIHRPEELARDDSPEILAWKHALNYLKNSNSLEEFMLSLPATSPLRTKSHIREAIKILNRDNEVQGIIGITKSDYHPGFNMVKTDNNVIKLYDEDLKLFRRQDGDIFNITTNFYLFRTDYILETENIFDGRIGFVEIPKINSIDIDDIIDFKVAESLFDYSQNENEIEK